jgi:hypothetical protein
MTVPTRYKLFKHHHYCKHCRTTHIHSEFVAIIPHRGGTRGEPLRNGSDVAYNLPVDVVTTMDSMPFCHECWAPGLLKGLPLPTPQPKPVTPSWQGLGVHPDDLKPKPKPQPQPKQPKSLSAQLDELDI